MERTLAVLCRSHPARESARDSRKLQRAAKVATGKRFALARLTPAWARNHDPRKAHHATSPHSPTRVRLRWPELPSSSLRPPRSVAKRGSVSGRVSSSSTSQRRSWTAQAASCLGSCDRTSPVYDDNRQVDVTHFSAERVPVSLGIVLDTSGSMAGDKIANARAAIDRFLDRLLTPEDEVFLFRFFE